jgi:hypothetical protein
MDKNQKLKIGALSRCLVIVGDGVSVIIELVSFCSSLPKLVTFFLRLRLDAALLDPPAVQVLARLGGPPKKGRRQPSLPRRIDDSNT